MPVHIVPHSLDDIRIALQIVLVHIPVQERGAIGAFTARIQVMRQHLHNAGAGQRCTVLQPTIPANIAPKASNFMSRRSFAPAKRQRLADKTYAQQLRF